MNQFKFISTGSSLLTGFLFGFISSISACTADEVQLLNPTIEERIPIQLSFIIQLRPEVDLAKVMLRYQEYSMLPEKPLDQTGKYWKVSLSRASIDATSFLFLLRSDHDIIDAQLDQSIALKSR